MASPSFLPAEGRLARPGLRARPARASFGRASAAGRRGANTAEVIILSAVAALTLLLGVRLFG